MRIVSLLSSLGKNYASSAAPAMAQALRDEDASIRAMAVTYFNDTENEDCLLNQLDRRTKKKLLPDLIQGLQGDDLSLRNNAALTLGNYSEESKRVLPVLAGALQDTNIMVRQAAAESIFRVAPEVVVGNGTVSTLLILLEQSDAKIAYRAANLLGKIAKQPELTVPALIASLKSSSSLTASSAARALANFPQQANEIVPALSEAMNSGPSSVRRAAEATRNDLVGPK